MSEPDTRKRLSYLACPRGLYPALPIPKGEAYVNYAQYFIRDSGRGQYQKWGREAHSYEAAKDS